jgi:hypothetical protein
MKYPHHSVGDCIGKTKIDEVLAGDSRQSMNRAAIICSVVFIAVNVAGLLVGAHFA